MAVEGLEETMSCLHRQVREEKVAGKGMPSPKKHVKAAVEETSDGARESQKCDNEVQKTWLCSSMSKAVSVGCHAQRECIEGSRLFLQGRKAESCALTLVCSQQLTGNHSLTY